MRVDELNTEEDARMDALENRTRALAARLATVERERDSAQGALEGARRARKDARDLLAVARAETEHVVAERDAAVKAKEEAWVKVAAAEERIAEEAAESSALLADARAEAASLRAQVEQERRERLAERKHRMADYDECSRQRLEAQRQVEQLTVERSDYAVKADGSYREIQRLVAQVEQVRGALEKSQREEKRLVRELIDLHLDDVQPPSTVEEAEAIMREAGVDPEAFLQRAREHVARVRAALSPSTASGLAAENGTCATCTTGYHDGCDSECSCRQCAPGKDEATR